MMDIKTADRPSVPIELLLQRLADDSGKAQALVQKASEILRGPLETEIATTPYEVVYEEDRVKLKHYKPVTKTVRRPPS